MNAKEVNILIWDTPDNFDEQTQRILGKNAFKKVYRFNDIKEFKIIYDKIKDNENIVVCCHVAYKDFSGYFGFKNSQIKEEFNIPRIVYLSTGDSAQVMQELRKEYNTSERIIKYNELLKDIRADEIKPFTKNSILAYSQVSDDKQVYTKCKYAIITALEEVEMEKVLTIIEKDEEFKDSINLIEYGHFYKNEKIKIAYASQHQTGMVDAAILSTELILRFEPEYLIMVGVLGGNPNSLKIGDIAVATKVFTIDKGKIDKLGFHKESEGESIDNPVIPKIKRQKKLIEKFIEDSDKTRNKSFTIHFGPIGCVRQVIDSDNYFDEVILKIDRKSIALEMESYAVVRACKLINEGRTKPIIIKGVMDNTKDKTDDSKPLAAWNSVKLLEYLFENEII